jgi:hypothetical protein
VAEPVEEVPAVQDRHEHVEQDEVRPRPGRQQAQGLLAVGGRDDPVAGAAEHDGQPLAGHVVVFHDQERRAGGGIWRHGTALSTTGHTDAPPARFA